MVDGKLFFAITLLSFTAMRFKEEEDEKFMQMKNSTNEKLKFGNVFKDSKQNECNARV